MPRIKINFLYSSRNLVIIGNTPPIDLEKIGTAIRRRLPVIEMQYCHLALACHIGSMIFFRLVRTGLVSILQPGIELMQVKD